MHELLQHSIFQIFRLVGVERRRARLLFASHCLDGVDDATHGSQAGQPRLELETEAGQSGRGVAGLGEESELPVADCLVEPAQLLEHHCLQRLHQT